MICSTGEESVGVGNDDRQDHVTFSSIWKRCIKDARLARWSCKTRKKRRRTWENTYKIYGPPVRRSIIPTPMAITSFPYYKVKYTDIRFSRITLHYTIQAGDPYVHQLIWSCPLLLSSNNILLVIQSFKQSLQLIAHPQLCICKVRILTSYQHSNIIGLCIISQ